MTAENAKQKTNNQLQNSSKKKEILRSSVIGCPFSTLRFLLSSDLTFIIPSWVQMTKVEKNEMLKTVCTQRVTGRR